MPQEFLRDVLRAGDASARTRRRLSVLPLSIGAHVVAVAGFVAAPFLTDGELPRVVIPLFGYIETVSPPPPPVVSPPRTTTPVNHLAPITAPSEVSPEVPRTTSDAAIDGALPPGPGIDPGGGSVLSVMSTNVNPVLPPEPPPLPQPKVHRVGQGVREPKKLVHVAPEYPAIALNARKEGTVMLEALLDETGKVVRIRVVKSEPLLDAAAMRAVQQWRYTPTLLNNVPVPVLMTITVRFSLTQ